MGKHTLGSTKSVVTNIAWVAKGMWNECCSVIYDEANLNPLPAVRKTKFSMREWENLKHRDFHRKIKIEEEAARVWVRPQEGFLKIQCRWVV